MLLKRLRLATMSAGAFLLLALLVVLLVDRGRLPLDGDLLRIAAHVENPILEDIVVVLAFLGAGAGLMLLLSCALWWLWIAGRRRDALFVAGALLLSQVLGRILKNVVGAPRPGLTDHELIAAQSSLRQVVLIAVAIGGVAALASGYRRAAIGLGLALALCMAVFEYAAPAVVSADSRAFPSGHATSSMAFVAALALVMRTAPARLRVALWGGLLVAGVGLSRIVMGVHHPTDVLAGWALSLGVVSGLALLLLRTAPGAPAAERLTRSG